MRLSTAVAAMLLLFATSGPALSHCEIPCGIYGDDAKFSEIAENLTTIKKSMEQILALSADPAKNMNQLVRWVNNKEVHADKISHTVTQYFLTQRIKAPDAGDAAAMKAYQAKLSVLHQMMRTAMVCKQTTDVANVEKLQKLTDRFRELYAGK